MNDTSKYKFITGLVNSTAKAFFVLNEFSGINVVFIMQYEDDLENIYESFLGLKSLYPDKYNFAVIYLG